MQLSRRGFFEHAGLLAASPLLWRFTPSVRPRSYAQDYPDMLLAWLRSGVDAIGKGSGALWVLYAAVLDGRIRAAVAERGLISYASLTRVDRYLHSAGVFVRDVLTSFDLPQVAAAVADRRLSLLSPVGPMKEVDVPMAQREYEFTRQVYLGVGAGDRFAISGADVESYTADEYLRLLG